MVPVAVDGNRGHPCMIVIEKLAATINGERNEVHVDIGIDDPAIRTHPTDFGVV